MCSCCSHVKVLLVLFAKVWCGFSSGKEKVFQDSAVTNAKLSMFLLRNALLEPDTHRSAVFRY